MTITVRPATIHDADSACAVLHRSIVECCAADHRGDPAVIEAWLWNTTPENVRTWLGVTWSFAVVAEVRGEIVGFALCSADGEVLLCYVVQEVRFTGARL